MNKKCKNVNKSLILAIAVCSVMLPSSSQADKDNKGLAINNSKNAPIIESVENDLKTKKQEFANTAKQTENAVNETNKEINNTKTKEEQIKEIDNKVNDLTEEKTNLENKIKEDKTEVSLKEENNKILEEKLQNATTKMNELDTKRQEIVSDKNATEKDIEKANKEYEELKVKYEKAKNDASKFTGQDKARLEELEKDYKEAKKSGLRFFEKNGDEATKNEIKNASEKDSGFTDENGKKQSQLEMATELDEEYSAFGIDNMITAAETLVQVNKDREKAGLPKLNTSHYMQFLAGLKIEGDRRVNTHYKEVSAGAENLIWSDSYNGFLRTSEPDGIDSFYNWFYAEKDNVIKAAKEIDPDVELKTNEDVNNFIKAHKDELNDIIGINAYGHFENLMFAKDQINQGMAYAKSSNELRDKMGDSAGKYDNILNNTFNYRNSAGFMDPEDAELLGIKNAENIMTPEELLEQLKAFKETDTQLKNEYEALSKKAISRDNSALVKALAEQLKASQEKMAKLKEKLQEATTNLEQVNNELGAATYERGQLAENIAKTNAEINTLKEEINTNIEKVNDIKKQINDLNDKKAKIQGTEEPGEKDPEEKPDPEKPGEKDPEEKPDPEKPGEKDPEEKPDPDKPGKKDPTEDQKASEPDKNQGSDKEKDPRNIEKDKKSEIKDKKKNPTENKSESSNQKNNPATIKKYSNNVKTGVPSLGAVLTLLNFSTIALFKSKKRK